MSIMSYFINDLSLAWQVYNACMLTDASKYPNSCIFLNEKTPMTKSIIICLWSTLYTKSRFDSELLENREEMFPSYYMHNDDVFSMFTAETHRYSSSIRTTSSCIDFY